MIQELIRQIKDLQSRVDALESREIGSISRFNIKSSSTDSDHELTIDTGEVTVTKTYHLIDTEGDAGSDALTTINGGEFGDILIIRAADSARDVVVTDGGNLRLAGDFTMDHAQDTMILFRTATAWLELARSDNNT